MGEPNANKRGTRCGDLPQWEAERPEVKIWMAGSFYGQPPLFYFDFLDIMVPCNIRGPRHRWRKSPFFCALRGRFAFTIRAGVGFQFFAKGNLFYAILPAVKDFFAP
jgi:hypothetical protein